MNKSLTRAALVVAILAWSANGLAFDGIRLTLLGTGSPHDGGEQVGPATLIEASDEVLLVDCGPGTVQRLAQARVWLREITAVFLTSLDPQQISGCRELWRACQEASSKPPPVWGPEGTAALFRSIAADSGQEHAEIEAYDIADNVVYQPEGATVTAFVTDYPAARQSFGYRIDSQGRAVTLSGGTRYSENLIRYARGAHVLVHEVAAASAGPAASEETKSFLAMHTSPEDAGKTFKGARPYLAVYSPIMLFGVSEEELLRRTRRFYRGLVEIGRDLMIIEVQNEVQIRSAPSDGRRADR